MSVIRFAAAADLAGFLHFLSQGGRRVLVPVEQAGARPSVVFAEWRDGQPFTLAKADVPPKAAVLPRCETLFKYKKGRPASDGQPAALAIEAETTARPTVVFACRACDARGFAVLDRAYLAGRYADPYYRARREDLCVITLTCATGCSTCFCHWVGGGPSSPEDSDVLMTEVSGGYVLQSVTRSGEELLAACGLPDGADRFQDAALARRAAWASLAAAPDLKGAGPRLAGLFAREDFWTRQTERCLSCAACTYFCPTCYCFNISDEGEAQSEAGGRRLRSWDSCMSALFTLEASGHNPRQTVARRMRNRILHKFAWYPEKWGVFSCNGCGRCITNCPVNLDIREIVLSGLTEAAQGQ